MSAANKTSTNEAVDKEAREEIDRLRRRLEGAHLVPSAWTLVKQMFQSIISWGGWEIFGLGSFVLAGLAILTGIIMFTVRGCTADTMESNQAEFVNFRERYGPACESMGLVFTEHSGRIVVCTGADRIVTIDTSDIDETETHFLTPSENRSE